MVNTILHDPQALQLVVWDWNGTLLDDTALCFAIANRMRAERGMPVMAALDEYRSMFGFPVVDYYRRMGYTFETESYDDVSREFVARYAEAVGSCPLQPHAAETLDQIRRRGLSQVLLSATGADRLAAQAALFDLPQYFERIIGCENNLAHGKADQARALLQASGIAPAQALFIGDTDHDFAIASSVGCPCLLLTRGHHTASRLRALGATLIDDLDAVCRYLDGGLSHGDADS